MNILYLVKKQTYLTKMSRVRFHGIQALSKLPNVNVVYWGIGWEHYDNNIPVQQNIDSFLKNHSPLPSSQKQSFDVVIVYKPLEMKNFKDVKALKCIRYNEMYDVKWTQKEILKSGSQLVICHHLNDCQYYQQLPIAQKVKFVYIGHCAEKKIFKNYNLTQEYDILVAGCTSSHYPLRNRFLKLLPILRQKYRCYQHPHPGYDLHDAHTDRYLKEMAKSINKARITLTDTGRPRSRYGKYIEIPMCGTSAICGDLPGDKGPQADNYNFVIEVNNSMSDKEIINRISYYLDNEDARLDKVKQGLQFSKNYTQEHYAKRLFQQLEKTI